VSFFGRRRSARDAISVVRADARTLSQHDGIRTLHVFAAGADYDADNVSFGALVGVDDHTLAPGAEFSEHAHRGVAIVTWVVSGTLRHSDDAGGEALLGPGDCAVQIAGSGVRHVEANASPSDPVRFVQTTLVSATDAPSHRVVSPPAIVDGALFDVHRSRKVILEAKRAHVYVVEGDFLVEDTALYPGDSARISGEAVTLNGTGTALILLLR
jgi:redox-sensitive bicupin YhaK (pirin superfamily)